MINLYEVLMSDDVVASVNDNWEFLIRDIPELKEIIGFEHNNPQHHLDVWKHTLLALSMAPMDFEVRLTLLLHDIGKKRSCVVVNGINHYPNHPNISADMSLDILRRLNYKEEFISKIGKMVRLHDTPIKDSLIKEDYDLVLKLYEVQRCDALAHHPDKLDKRKEYLRLVKKKIEVK